MIDTIVTGAVVLLLLILIFGFVAALIHGEAEARQLKELGERAAREARAREAAYNAELDRVMRSGD